MILILYATHTGYTQEVAGLLYKELTATLPHLEFKLLNAREADAETIKKYPLVIFGASTWDDGLNPDTKIFLENTKDADLSKNKFALFGLGDKQFLVFCAAQPIIGAQLKKQGASVLSPVFTFDNYQSGENLDIFFSWAKNIISQAASAL